MTVQTLRPNATTASGSFTAIPSGTLNGVTSDNSDSTYARSSLTLDNPMTLELGTYALTATQRVKLARLRARYSANDSNSTGMRMLLVNAPAIATTLTANTSGTTPVDVSSGWLTPASELANAAINDARLQVAQAFSPASQLRVYELYVDLDVRDQPVINDFAVDVTLGEPTYEVTFTYGTSGNNELVTVEVVVTDSDGNVVTTFTEQVAGTDFSSQVVTIEHGEPIAADEYTATARVIAPGFSPPQTTFISATEELAFSVIPAGVSPPDLSCETDQAAQMVTLTICQVDDAVPVGTDCLVMDQQIFEVTDAGEATFGPISVSDLRHVAVWYRETEVDGSTYNLVDTEVLYDTGANELTVTGTWPGAGDLLVVYAHVDVGEINNAQMFLYQWTGSGDLNHGLGTLQIIPQVTNVQTGQVVSEVGLTMPFNGRLTIDNSTGDELSILLLVPNTADDCLISVSEAITAPSDTVVNQFARSYTMVTFFDEDGYLSYVGVELGSQEINLDTTTNGTLHFSGILATFDDPDAVRAQVQRDGVDLWLDGDNGALVPAFTDGCLTVIDRFPARYREPCAGDDPPDGPVYRVRFYGYVEGVPSYSAWSVCQPDAVISNGQSLLRHPTDSSLDTTNCTLQEDYNRVRPAAAVQPVNGGMPFARVAPWGGRDRTLIFSAQNAEELQALEDLLVETYFWYAPMDPSMPTQWLAPTGQLGVVSFAHKQRPYTVTQNTTEIEPDPVVLPPFGIDS